MKRSIIPIFVPHLGCPNQCVFCNQKRISGHSGRPEVKTEIERALKILEPAGIKPQVAFYGGSFTAIPEQEQIALLDEAMPFINEDRVCSLRISTRPDCIDSSVIHRLKKYRVETVELGAQSMDDVVLKTSKRGHTAEDTEEAAKALKENGFELVLQMMTGLPGDSGGESIASAERIIELKPDAVRIYPAAVLPDTELEEMWRSGEYVPQSVEAAVELCSELLKLFMKAKIPVIRLGLNPSKELDESVLAGAYHPALGDMVMARLYRKEASKVLSGSERGKIVLGVNPKHIGSMVGYKRGNILWFREHFGIDIKVKPVNVPVGEIVLL